MKNTLTSVFTHFIRAIGGEGQQGNDYMYANGRANDLIVCPASALPAALDLVSFRRATRATTR